MHSPQSRMAPGVNGFDLGFYQENRNGLRIIGHAGDTEAFHSDLHLLLDKHVGVFMSFNSLGKDGESDKVRTALFRAFLDRYFPYAPPEEKTVADPKPMRRASRAGMASSRRIDSSLRLLFAIGQSAGQRAPGRHDRNRGTEGWAAPRRWREVGPLGLSRSRRPDAHQIRHRRERKCQLLDFRRLSSGPDFPACAWARAAFAFENHHGCAGRGTAADDRDLDRRLDRAPSLQNRARNVPAGREIAACVAARRGAGSRNAGRLDRVVRFALSASTAISRRCSP
jgi:hypothetical protein